MNWKKILHELTILFVICLSLVFWHEASHYQVTHLHGCKEISVEVNWMAVEMSCDEYYERIREVELSEIQMQSWVEIIGYHVTIIVITLYLLLRVKRKED